jgi:hypothetical protein
LSRSHEATRRSRASSAGRVRAPCV